jgi:hypothetical protein
MLSRSRAALGGVMPLQSAGIISNFTNLREKPILL